ncbi:putative conserved tandem plastid protein [Amphidinium carterae]
MGRGSSLLPIAFLSTLALSTACDPLIAECASLEAHDDALWMLQKRVERIASASLEERLLANETAEDEVCESGGVPNKMYFLKVKKLLHNNLGGMGPDTGAPEMRFRIQLANGPKTVARYDMLIKNMTQYIPKDASKNGVMAGEEDFFRINVRGKTHTQFQVIFVEMGTETKVKFDDVLFTWYDIDRGSTRLTEKLLVKGFYKYTLTETTHLVAETDKSMYKKFRSPSRFKGTGVPFDPMELTREQMDVAVLLHFKESSGFKFKLYTTGSKTVGRNFMFSGTSKLTKDLGLSCDFWGDPHISGFDETGFNLMSTGSGAEMLMKGFDTSLASRPMVPLAAITERRAKSAHHDLREGDMWLVKSETVQIQGRFGLARDNRHSFLKAVAIGGSFLQGNTLRLGTNEGLSLWNKKPILQLLNSTFMRHLDDSLVLAKYHSAVQHVKEACRTTEGVEVSLPEGIKVVLNRFDTWLGLRIHMQPVEGGQDGECGNFNGSPDDDNLESIQDRMDLRVADAESLFSISFPRWQAAHNERRTSFMTVDTDETESDAHDDSGDDADEEEDDEEDDEEGDEEDNV